MKILGLITRLVGSMIRSIEIYYKDLYDIPNFYSGIKTCVTITNGENFPRINLVKIYADITSSKKTTDVSLVKILLDKICVFEKELISFKEQLQSLL